MSDHPAIAVIGSGIIGTLTAFTLLRQHHRVTLIERDTEALCCSTGNAGSLSASSVAPVGMPGLWKSVPSMLLDPDGALSIQPSYALPAAPWLWAFLKASQAAQVEKISAALHALSSPAVEKYRQILQALDAQELLAVTGQLHVYSSAQAREKDANAWRLRRHYGADVQFLDHGQLHDLEPEVGPQYGAGVYIPSDGAILNPTRLLQTMRARFVALGGTLLSAQVDRVIPRDGAVEVQTSTERRTYAKAVIAGGAWSNQLSKPLGDDLPLQTQRGYHAVLPDAAVRIQRPVIAAEAKVFASPMEMGLRFAGTVEFARLDSPPSPRRAESLLRAGRQLFPHISQAQADQHTQWMGNRPCMPDSLPVLDRSSASPNIVYAFGHGHLGLTHAPASVDRVIALLEGRPGDALTPAYSAQRFG